VRRAAAAVLAVGAVAAAGCGLADHAEPASFADVRAVVADAGLRVCDETSTEARAPGAVEEHRYDVAFACGDDDDEAVVVATAYEGEEDRDGAVVRYRSQPLPHALGVLWTLGPLTVRVSGDRDPAVVDALTEALDEAGAE
jgi:hypothetical protein